MAAKNFLRLVNGVISQVVATVVSAGAANAGDIPALDDTGKLDVSLLPVGVGPDVSIVVASEAITAGKYVNIYDNAGVPNCRLADASNDRPAHGWAKTSAAISAPCTVYFEGPNDNLTGLTSGQRQYLNTAGGVTTTPRTTGIHQLLGVAVSTTIINTDIEDKIAL